MTIKQLEDSFSICKVPDFFRIDLNRPFHFAARTDEESSLVCPTAAAPGDAVAREDGWRAFRIEGVLDFSLIGILAKISTLLAGRGIGIFAVSTFNTDYIFVRQENFSRALKALGEAGYELR